MLSFVMAALVRKAVDERFYLPRAKGGGVLRREIWIDERARVVRYNLAYINAAIYAGDNGRVIGYDSAHGSQHRHYKGETAAVLPKSYRQIEARFAREWRKLAKEVSG